MPLVCIMDAATRACDMTLHTGTLTHCSGTFGPFAFRAEEDRQTLIVADVDRGLGSLYLQLEKVRLDENGSNTLFVISFEINEPASR